MENALYVVHIFEHFYQLFEHRHIIAADLGSGLRDKLDFLDVEIDLTECVDQGGAGFGEFTCGAKTVILPPSHSISVTSTSAIISASSTVLHRRR